MRIRDLLTDEEYVKQRQELEREQIRAAQRLDGLRISGTWFEPAEIFISFSNRAVSWFKVGDLQTKRLILETVGSNPVLKDKKLNIHARKPFRIWANKAVFSDWQAYVEDVRTLAEDPQHAALVANLQLLKERLGEADLGLTA